MWGLGCWTSLGNGRRKGKRLLRVYERKDGMVKRMEAYYASWNLGLFYTEWERFRVEGIKARQEEWKLLLPILEFEKLIYRMRKIQG